MLRLAILMLAVGLPQHTELVYAAPCITKVEVTDKTECSGRDKEHIVCRGLLMTVRRNCESVRIVKGE